MKEKTTMRRNVVSLLCWIGGALTLVACLQPAYAGEYHWISMSDGAFHDPASWSPTGPPGSTDLAVFDQALPYYASMETPLTIHKHLRVSAGEVTFLMGVPVGDDYDPATYTLLGSGGFINTAAAIGTLPGVSATLRIRDHGFHGIPTAYVNAEGMLILGQVTDSTGTLRIGDSSEQDTIWNSSSPTLIGLNGTGVLEIFKDDQLINSSATLGLGAGSEGTATVFHRGCWTTNGVLTIGNDGTGTLNVYDEVTNGGDAYIAKEPGSVGTVNVDPDGSFMYTAYGWTCGGSLYVGGDDEAPGGDATLLINAGGEVDVGEDITVWTYGAITVDEGFLTARDVTIRNGGSITLNGPEDFMGGELDCEDMQVWYTGTLTINPRADVDCSSLHNLGTIEIADGDLSVLGQLTGITSSNIGLSGGALSVGTLAGYDGNLNWTEGAVNITADSLSIDVDEPFGINLQVGAGKSLSVADALSVGPVSNGIMSIVAGGTVESDSAVIGSLSPSAIQASALLNGTDTSWTIAGDLAVGSAVVSHLSVVSGATVTNDNARLASVDGTNALVTLYGATDHAQWSCGGDLYVGGTELESRGAATIEVDADAEVNVAGTMKVWSDSVVEIDGGTVVTPDLDIAGEVVVLSGTLDMCGSMVDIDTGGTLNGAIVGDSYTEVTLHGSYTSWLVPGSIVIGAGDQGEGHVGGLQLADGATVTVDENVTIPASSRLILAGGTINAALIDLQDEDFSDFGTLNGEFSTTGSVTATGTLTVGDIDSYSGVQIDGALDVGSHQVTINKNGSFVVGTSTNIAGGTLVVPNGIAISTGNELVAYGAVSAPVAAQTGSTIEAVGSLSLGEPASPVGFIADGNLVVNANTVTLEDANQAALGPMTTLGAGGSPGTLAAPNGLVLSADDNALGFGVIDTPDDPTKPLTNDGAIIGDSASERIELAGYVKGLGTMDYVTISGTDDPGSVGPAAVDRGSVDYAGNLVIEIGGLFAGTQHDQINHSGDVSFGGELTVGLLAGFEPELGDSFTILTYASHAGEFDTFNLPPLATGLEWQVNYGPSDLTLEIVGGGAPLVGDCDLDGDVDLSDLAQLLASYGITGGATWGDGDFDADGDVDLSDLAALLANYGEGL